MNNLEKKLKDKKIAIIGAGGLGGYVIEELARLNIGELIIFDGDSFDNSNLNRQLYSTKLNLGKNKAEEAFKRVEKISNTKVIFYNFYFNESSEKLLQNINLIIDCTDNISTKLFLEKVAEKLNVPLIHGGVYSSVGQVLVSMPKSNCLAKLYKNNNANIGQANSFSVAMVASLQVSEAYKLLTENGDVLCNKLLSFDLLNNEFIITKIL